MAEALHIGLACTVGETSVLVAPAEDPNGWFISLITGEMKTEFRIKEDTFHAILILMMKQGGFSIPFSNMRVVLPDEEAKE